ncbi:MAG: glycosyltransferase family 39 protein [Ignavibacteriales bacterium]|nr:glycosyltransferase family 39 protein [Ignavibacteriales bacterium]
MNDMFMYTPDSSRYLIWAKSLAHVEGYKDTSVLEPAHYVVHAPFYSLMLAPIAGLFPNSVIAAKYFTLFLGGCMLMLFGVWASQRVGDTAAMVGMLFLAVHPLVLMFSTQILSDVAFGVCLILFFYLAERLVENDKDDQFLFWIFLCVVIAGIFLREVGLTLMFSATLFFIMRKEYKKALLVFVVPLVFYFLWYVRNEVLVVGLENPALRNSKVFVTRYFTAQGSSLLTEFLARIQSNADVYQRIIRRLVFMPEYLERAFAVVRQSDPPLAVMNAILRYAQYPISLFSIGFFVYGIVVSIKKSVTLLMLLFLLSYVALILLYPINDIRFLFPLLILMVYFMLIGLKHCTEHYISKMLSQRAVMWSGAALVILLAIPNIVWCYSFTRTSVEYKQSPVAFYEKNKAYADSPELFTKPLSIVGKWLVDHSDSGTVIGTRWKEIDFWLQGRKQVEMHPLLTLDMFETMLRDYNVRYILSTVTRPGLNEFEALMAQSRRFRFETVYTVAAFEVLQVHPANGNMSDFNIPDSLQFAASLPQLTPKQRGARYLFLKGMHLLEEGKTQDAEEIFKTLRETVGSYGPIVLHQAVAKEFSMRLDEASKEYERFRSIPQVGAYLEHAWYHQELIGRLRKAESDPSPAVKAFLYHTVSVNYWDLGFRHQAEQILERSLQADSSFYPALMFGAYYALQNRDTLKAKMYSARLNRIDASHDLARGLAKIFVYFDSLKSQPAPLRRAEYHVQIAKTYVAMGLREIAIDELLRLKEENLQNKDCLRLLAELYEGKGRYYPAVQALRQLVVYAPDDQEAKTKLLRLLERW